MSSIRILAPINCKMGMTMHIYLTSRPNDLKYFESFKYNGACYRGGEAASNTRQIPLMIQTKRQRGRKGYT